MARPLRAAPDTAETFLRFGRRPGDADVPATSGPRPPPSWPTRARARIGHVAAKLAVLTLGAAYVSGPAAALRARLDRRRGLPAFAGRAALVAHAYYPDLVDEILACFGRLPAGSDLIVTTPADRRDAVAAALGDKARVTIRTVENRGRDIAPFLTLLNEGAFARYDAVLKLHTKRSPHLRDGTVRRRLLLTMLAGSTACTGRVLRLFEDQQTGMAGWRPSFRHSTLFWMLNEERVRGLARDMGALEPEAPAFFEGSMFWFRPAALDRLRSLNLTTERFENEAGQLDGTLHHAVERVFCLSATAQGFAVRDLHGNLLVSPST